jgi:hypothetical protein
LIPAHVRDFQFWILDFGFWISFGFQIWDFGFSVEMKTRDGAAKNPESFDANSFLAGIEETLQTETNSQKWFACLDEIANGVHHFELLQIFHAIAKRADAWQYDRIGSENALAVGNDADITADADESFLDAAEVAHAVINECYHEGQITKILRC